MLFQCNVLNDGFHLGVVDGDGIDGDEHQSLLSEFGVEIGSRSCLFHCHIVGGVAELDVALVGVTGVDVARVGLCWFTGTVGIGIDSHGSPFSILQLLHDTEVGVGVVGVLLPSLGYDERVVLGVHGLTIEFGDATATRSHNDYSERCHCEIDKLFHTFVFLMVNIVNGLYIHAHIGVVAILERIP